VVDGGTGSTAPSLAGGSNAAIAVSVASSWPNQTIAATLSPASHLTQLGWYSVKDYGATGNGSTDDTQYILNAIAALDNISGVLYFPSGTYVVSEELLGQNDELYRYWVGAGMDATTIIAINPQPSGSFPTGVPVVNFQSNGGVMGMTINANALAQLGLGFGNDSNLALDHWRCIDVRAMNVGSSGNWVAVFSGNPPPNGPPLSFTINELRIDDCIFEGPSNASFDGFTIANVTDCFVTNLTLRNMSRSPNFYYVSNLKVDGLYVTGIPGYAGVVFDDYALHVELSNAYVDSTCAAALIRAPDFRAVNCVFESGVNFGMSNDPLPYRNGNVDADFTNCQFGSDNTSALPMSLNGNGTPAVPSGVSVNQIRCTNCEFAATTNLAHISNGTVSYPSTMPTTWPEMSLLACRFNSANLTGAACSLTSNLAATAAQPFVVVGCVNLNAVNPLGIYITTTLGALSNIRANLGFNPRQNFTPTTAISKGVAWTNTTGYDVTLLIFGGTSVVITVGGLTFTSGAFFIPIGAMITVTWSSPPSIAYMGS
jgi:hypothetical protein